MKEKILITGASGFVGYHLVTEAISQGYEVYAGVRKSSAVDHFKDLALRYVYLDYTSEYSLAKELERIAPDYIIHAAGVTKAKSQTVYNLINAEASRNLALATLKIQRTLKKFVLVSSLAALGPLKNLDGLIYNDSEPRPVTAYGASKLLAEQYLSDIPDLPLIGFRPTAVYGPRERDLFVLIKSINRGLDPYIGKLDQQLSFIYVKDLVSVIFSSLKKRGLQPFYNISDGEVYDRYALADTVKQLLKKKAIRLHLPFKGVSLFASLLERIYINRDATPVLNKEKINELTAVNWACDISALQRDFGFTPRYNLGLGLEETIDWYQRNHWL